MTSAIIRLVLIAGAALVGWLLFGLLAGPAQAVGPADGEGATGEPNRLLGLVPLPEPLLSEPDQDDPEATPPDPDDGAERTEPVAEVAEPVAEVVEQVTRSTEPVVEVVEPVTETVEQVTSTAEPVVESVEPVLAVVEPVTQTVEPVVATVAQVADHATVVLLDRPVVSPLVETVTSTVDPLLPTVDPLLPTVDPVLTPVEPVPAAVASPLEQILGPAPIPVELVAAGPAPDPGPAPLLAAVTTARAEPVVTTGPPEPPYPGVGPLPVWWPGSPPTGADAPDAAAATGAGPPRPLPNHPFPGPVSGPAAHQLAGSPTDPGQPLAWTGPTIADPGPDPVRPRIPEDVAGSGLTIPISAQPG